ncbi:putative Flp pilus-assembly TadE/G-like protein [Murinocardiopsis flavida]|uniref:Putative Flp pilus-assembly TadE/G-like protein n=1 Tax=Murinocardiopsis flavida TaxID=645275 RepID=A0A2P8DG22_9ACTN|nr:pilus assembly protein TadG-related protein [Murinocardiopsis flavida]PSK96162.1 putative Flp pilus-assembly TadE/G-like protein [Murinocardiopsis flavida]
MTPRHSRGDRGHASAFVICTMGAVIACLGLVYDAGGMLIQRGQASAIADEAARTGAQQLDLAALRATGQRRLDPQDAERAARTHLAEAGARGAIAVDGASVTVTARLDYTSRFLPIGARTAEASSTAAARAP